MPEQSFLFRWKSGTVGRALALLAASGLVASTDAQAKNGSLKPEVLSSSKVFKSPPLRSIVPSKGHARAEQEEGANDNDTLPRYRKLSRPETVGPDGALQKRRAPRAMPTPILSFLGRDNDQGVLPPDTNGDVGPNNYVQMVNLTFAVWDKSGNQIYPATAGNGAFLSDLYSAAGDTGTCSQTDDGDPIVLYDQFADRWLLSEFSLPNYPSGPFSQCIAVSQTGDPTGAYFLYTFLFSNTLLNDYPKFGVWPDAYYMAVNQFVPGVSFQGAGVVAFERDQMLAGLPARQVYFNGGTNLGGMLPTDADGLAQPPAGAPNIFTQFDDDGAGGPADQLELWAFHVDWTTPANSTFTNLANLATAPFDFEICPAVRGQCMDQPNTSVKLEGLNDRLMHRQEYRNFGTHQAMVLNHTVDATGSTTSDGIAGIRWYELRNDGSGWAIYQQGTYQPDTDHRWMGSAAMDKDGDIAVGYSVSSTTTFPSIRYAGRLSGDPLGDLAQGETELIAGGGSQTNVAARWGDYSGMVVDPIDDCTFWYTQEYLETTSSANWKTRVGSFKFPTCTAGPSGSLSGTVTSSTRGGPPIAGAQVKAMSATITLQTSTDSNGQYHFASLPVDTYDVTVTGYGFLSNTQQALITDGGATVLDFSLDPAPAANVSGKVTDGSGHGWPLYATVQISTAGFGTVATLYTNPETGDYSAALFQDTTYTFVIKAVSPGYNSKTDTVGPLTGDVTDQDYTLTINVAACEAPGYALDVKLREDFTSETLPAGWDVIDNIGSGAEWVFNDPGGRGNLTPGGTGGFAIADSDNAGFVPMDTELRTPVLDLTGVTNVTLQFATDFYVFSGFYPEIADVDLSTNGGTSFTNVFRRQEADGSLNDVVQVPIPGADNQSNAQLRFRYYNASFEFWWEVDNVRVGHLTIPTGPPVLFSEDFNSGIPGTWDVVDNAGSGAVWRGDNPGGRPNQTGGTGAFAIADSDFAGLVNMDTELISPAIDLSTGANPTLVFKTNFNAYSGYLDVSDEIGDVDLSVNGGAAWTNVWRHTEADGDIGPATINVPLAAAANQSDVKVRFHYYDAYYDFWWMVDDVVIQDGNSPAPPSFDCIPVAGGLVIGNVYDDNLGTGVNAATVSIDGSSPTISVASGATPNDPAIEDGYYSLFVPSPPVHSAAVMLTASKTNYSSDTEKVFEIDDQVVRQDFVLGAGLLTYAPSSVEVTLGLGDQTTANVNFQNVGSLPVDFELREGGEGFVILRPTSFKAPSKAAHGPGVPKVKGLPSPAHAVDGAKGAALPSSAHGAGTADLLRAAKNSLPGWTGKLHGKVSPKGTGTGKHAQQRGSNVDLILDDGTAENSIGLTAGGQFLWLNRFTPDPSAFPFKLDNVQILYQSGTGVNPGDLIDIYVYEDTDGDGDPGTGANFIAKFNNVAVQNADGVNFDLYPLDPAPVLNGPGDVLIAVVNRTAGTSAGEFPAAIDQTSSQVRSWVGAYGGNPPDPPPLPAPSLWGTIDSFGLAGNWMVRGQGSPADIIWLTEDPTSGSLDPGNNMDVGLGFDASLVDQPGTYTASLSVSNNTPYHVTPVAVTMNVTPPANWGKVTGVVSGLGYCDATPGTPLKGASVTIDGVIADLKTGADGSFARWMEEGTYDMHVSADGYVTSDLSFTVTAGGTLTQNVDLRLDAPCTSRDPDSFSVELPVGATMTTPLSLTNAGGGELDFSLLETDRSLPPLGRRVKAARPATKAPTHAAGRDLRSASYRSLPFAPAGARSPVSLRSFDGTKDFSGWFGGAPIPVGLVRYAHAQCPETPHLFYVIGGVDDSFNGSDKTLRYDSSTNEWTELATFPGGGSEAPTGTCYQGKIYVMGGDTIEQNLFIYDTSSNTWSTGASLPRPAVGAAAAAWDGFVYLFGGLDSFTSGNVSAEVDIYDIANDTWVGVGTDIPVTVWAPGNVQAGEFVYLVGGFGDGSPTGNDNTTLRYSMTDDTWSTGPDFTSARADFALAITDKALYAIGGDQDGGAFFDVTKEVERLDWTTWPAGSWVEEAAANELPVALTSNNAGFCTTFLGNAAIWSVGGGDPFGAGAIFNFNSFRLLSSEKCFSIYGDVPWLSETPASGSIGSDSADDVNVTFDATGLTVGSYVATLVMPTNDPGKPLFQIPVNLDVIPAVYNLTLTTPSAAKSGNPGANVTYTLTVKNTGNIKDTYTVSKTGNVWTTATPATVGPLDPGQSTNITVTVTVAANANGLATDTAAVKLTSQGNGGVSKTLSLTTTANKVFAVAVTPGNSVQTTPGTAVTYTLKVTNNGNSTDTFNVGVAVTGNAWTTTPASATVGPLARGATANLNVTVQVPAGQTSGATSTAAVTLTSQGNNTVKATGTLITIVSTANNVLLTPTSQIQLGDAGHQVIFTIAVKNIGNASDTFDLTLTGATWPTILSSTFVGPLAPNAMTNVTLTVNIPAGSPIGSSSAAILTARSRSNPSIAASAALVAETIHSVGSMGLLGASLLVILLAAAAVATRRRRSSPRLG
jgi:uncharacterized membrane protein